VLNPRGNFSSFGSGTAGVKGRLDGGTIMSVSGTVRASTAPVEVDRPSGEEVVEPDLPWLVIVWNDPINLMSYVTFVFQKLFGYSREKATRLMLDVHHKGKAVVSSGSREKAEFDTYRLHEHGLWATMQRA
jgi:ATP-dependent Clp protease adaptor protein ClpS